MKIAYFINHNIDSNDGITKKILGQKEAWESKGHQVVIFCNTPKLGPSILPANQYHYVNSFTLRFKLQDDLLNELEKFSPDIVYFRYNTLSRTLNSILKKYKVVTELNTYDLGEFYLLVKQEKSIKSLARYISYKLLRSNLLSRVSGIVAVTNEIAEHPLNKKFQKPTICIPNGIDLNKFQTIKTIQQTNNRISLFFIGSPNAPWHGVDIIGKMAKELPDYDFHIVGMQGKNNNNIFWYGFLQKIQYLKILEKCHICIGSLALFRNEMKEACPLKVREYLAYGYPIIIGYEDTVFLNTGLPEWALKVDSEGQIDFEELKKFIENQRNRVVQHSEIEFIGTDSLENLRLQFFEKIHKNRK